MPRKPRNRPPSQQALVVAPDYETDEAALSDAINMAAAPQRQRSTSELNLTVVRRHNQDVVSILAIAPYAVIYTFNTASQEWEKSGVEGSMFIVSLEGTPAAPERFAVMILNRRGLDNFSTELLSPDDVDVTEEYIILQTEAPDGTGNPGVPIIYGLWIFSQSDSADAAQAATIDMRSTIGQIIRECAGRTHDSRAAAAAQGPDDHDHDHDHDHDPTADIRAAEASLDDAEDPAAVPMGRQISLRDLFGRQRDADSGWSVQHHDSPKRGAPPSQIPSAPPSQPMSDPAAFQQPPPMPPIRHLSQGAPTPLETARQEIRFAPTPEMEFFQTAKPSNAPPPAVHGGMPTNGTGGAAGQQNALLDLFKSAQAKRTSPAGY